MTYRLFVRAAVPSKKNTYRPRKTHGMYRPAEVKAVIDGMVLQIRSQWGREPLEHASVSAKFNVCNGRSDLDNKFVTLMDALVVAGVIVNDSIKHVSRISAEAVIVDHPDESVEVVLNSVD